MKTGSVLAIAIATAAFTASSRADEPTYHVCCAANEDRPRCPAEEVDVVGYRRCASYGMWGDNLLEPYVFLDLGVTLRHFGTRDISPAAAARSTLPQGFGNGADEAYMFDERIGFMMTRTFYLAADFELGDIATDLPKSPTAHAIVVDGLASAGVRGGLGPFVLRGELAGGIMAASSTTRDLPTEGMLEARGRLDLWLSPWLTVGAAGGASLIHQGDWMTGLYLGFHTWAYAGDRW